MKEYNINIVKADNGWVIRTGGSTFPGAGRDLSSVIVVKDGENLGEMIAAALVAERLTAASDVDSKLLQGQVRSAMQNVYKPSILTGASTATVTTSTAMGQNITADKLWLMDQLGKKF